jgi:hypothetical protein
VLRTIVAYITPTRDASGVIYGTLVTAGTILGASEGAHDVLEVALTVIATVALYWIAHAYAEVVGNADVVAPSLRVAARELAVESRMVGACVLPLAILLVADLLGSGFAAATTIGLWSTVGLLFIWGLLAAPPLASEPHVGRGVRAALHSRWRRDSRAQDRPRALNAPRRGPLLVDETDGVASGRGPEEAEQ